MRFYAFGNYYLSSIQQGLQAAHVLARMGLSIEVSATWKRQFTTWARDHEVIVLLNGGNDKDLRGLAEFFNQRENPYIHASFCEDEQSLNGAMTSVGIILSEFVYETAAAIRQGKLYNATSVGSNYSYYNRNGFQDVEELEKMETLEIWINKIATSWDMEMINRLNACPLAK